MNRRFAAVLAPVLALSLAACTGDDQPKDPKAALVASTSGLKAGNYSFTATMPGDASAKGIVHIPSHTASLDLDTVQEGKKGKVQFRIAEPDRYVKLTMDLGETAEQLESLSALGGGDAQTAKLTEGLKAMVDLFSGKQWLKLDASKVKAQELRVGLENPDLTGATGLFGGIVSADRKGDVITGKLDVTKVSGDSQLFGESAVKGADPAQAKVVPYEATLDGDGRLTKLVLDMPKTTDSPAGKWTVQVSGYGAQAKQDAPPAAEVKEMPDSAYDMINGKG
ncbi:hypothetical protein AB0J80_02880 [Actinoplanes sp. NPDC049548]|uniref:hypothetical protein n=1 Tax=Actinoplanes sp. NPDC049548 TaxID=3155152 RepID=UPI00343F3EE8